MEGKATQTRAYLRPLHVRGPALLRYEVSQEAVLVLQPLIGLGSGSDPRYLGTKAQGLDWETEGNGY